MEQPTFCGYSFQFSFFTCFGFGLLAAGIRSRPSRCPVVKSKPARRLTHQQLVRWPLLRCLTGLRALTERSPASVLWGTRTRVRSFGLDKTNSREWGFPTLVRPTRLQYVQSNSYGPPELSPALRTKRCDQGWKSGSGSNRQSWPAGKRKFRLAVLALGSEPVR